MPPRSVKRGSASAGSKRLTRAAKGGAKPQNQPQSDVPKESRKFEDVPVIELEATDDLTVEEKAVVEENLVVVEENKRDSAFLDVIIDVNSNSNILAQMKKEDEVKDDGFEKDERLDLDDNEPEYEPEEYVGVDYDEKESEMEDGQEEVGEDLEDPEYDGGEEEETDMLEEDIEDVNEEFEGEEDDENVAEDQEHVRMGDAEEDEHHEVFKERRKRKEYEVFVGGLDKEATEDDLRKVFSTVGEITEVRLMMNPLTKKNKGFAFLRFPTVELAKRAVIELKNPVINGKQCGVTPSQDSDTLFLGNICKTWTKEALKEKLKHYGVDNVDDLTLVEDGNNVGTNRGFAFLEFESRSDAMDAFKRLQKRDVVFGVDRPAKVSFADSFIDPGDEIMAQVKTVFIDGLPAAWDEDIVRKLLKKYGGVEKVELARNMPSAKRKDFGFVTFETHDAAVTCAKNINNAELGEGDNKAKVRARLSRPLQRGRGKHGGRGDGWSGQGAGRPSRGHWGRPTSHSLPIHGMRGISSRAPLASFKRSIGPRDRRPIMSMPTRARPFVPASRPHDRRPPVPSYPKNAKREYGRHAEIHSSRNRVAVDYDSRIVQERRPSYRDEYVSRGPSYSDLPRVASRPPPRRAYADDGYGQRYERIPFTNYREGRARDYDSLSGSKRPYGSLDDASSRYADGGIRQSRARLDYEYGGSSSQYEDAYGDRLGRSNLSYGGSRGSMSTQDSHGLYGSRHGMGYGGGGSFGSSSDTAGMYSSSYGGDYVSRGSDVGVNSYSSMYPGRNAGGSSYMGGSGSGSYY